MGMILDAVEKVSLQVRVSFGLTVDKMYSLYSTTMQTLLGWAFELVLTTNQPFLIGDTNMLTPERPHEPKANPNTSLTP